ncbi:MAG: Hint domain-containing protein [Pseudomonadota bacterium]
MARISEMHYSNAFARTTGVDEFLEISLSPTEHLNPGDFTAAFYQADGTVGFTVTLDTVADVTYDTNANEYIYVISADVYPIFLTDPDGGGATNYEAYAIVNTVTGSVDDFYDIGGGTQNITALDGPAVGATSVNVPTPVGPDSTTTSIQFNSPAPDTVVYETLSPGDAGFFCFASGTIISTPYGQRPIESLQVGDIVLTQDRGPQAIRWRASCSVPGFGPAAPICFHPGVLGADQPLFVSPQHRMVLKGWEAQLKFGEHEVFAPASALLGLPGVERVRRLWITYHHLLLDNHEVIFANGVEAETFLPGPVSLEAVAELDVDRLLSLHPGLRSAPRSYGLSARPILRRAEGAQLLRCA